MLAASLIANKDGMVLASSQRPERIARFGLLVNDVGLQQSAAAFMEILKKNL
jgi:hypothetical protein